MFLTGRRINGETAQEWGLGDIYTDTDNVRSAAIELAQEIAENAPLALLSLREQMRPNIAEAVNDVTTIESREQKWLQQTSDHKEGIKAVAEKRAGNFTSH
jgi:enoyl-CoA hydratase/carnithine racemase